VIGLELKNSVEVAQIKTVKHNSVILKGYDEDTYRFLTGILLFGNLNQMNYVYFGLERIMVIVLKNLIV